jgi:hypothetical protein
MFLCFSLALNIAEKVTSLTEHTESRLGTSNAVEEVCGFRFKRNNLIVII